MLVAPPLVAWRYFNIEPIFRVNPYHTGKHVEGVSWREAVEKAKLVSTGHGTTISKDDPTQLDTDHYAGD
jgi:hypothetical protein